MEINIIKVTEDLNNAISNLDASTEDIEDTILSDDSDSAEEIGSFIGNLLKGLLSAFKN